MPIVILLNVAIITAPAAMSFAMPTSLEYLLWNIASSVNSIAEFTISAIITVAIAIKSRINSITLKCRQNPRMITKTATTKCILMFLSLFNANLIPLKEFLNVPAKPGALYFDTFAPLSLGEYLFHHLLSNRFNLSPPYFLVQRFES